MRTQFTGAALAVTALSLGSALVFASPASAVTATVPNNKVNVYKCSRYNGRCAYQYTYQTNPPYNPRVGTRYSNRYDYCWCWV